MGTPLGTRNRPTLLTLFTSVQAGIDERLAAGVTLGGVTYTAATLKAVFALAITAIGTAEALHTQWMDAVAAAHSAEATANAVYELLRSYVISQFGKTANAVLGDFGMSVPKPLGPKTAAGKAAGAAKSAATRKIRSSTKQVKGTMEVPVTAVTTIAPVMPASATAPAPAASTAPANGAASPKPGS
ncbi:MAG: hypothetical protein ABSE49_17730 [Polyangiaceae bacterium]